jgi:hypothetical protein
MGTINLSVQHQGKSWQTDGTVVTWTTASGTDDYRFPSSGREIVHFKCGTGPHNLTVTSQPDSPFGRHASGDDFVQAAASATEYVSQMFPRPGWADTLGFINMPAPNAQLSFWIEAVPL